MSTEIYPVLPGLMFPVGRASMWNTSIKRTPSMREFRTSPVTFPRYRYTLKYEFLRAALGEYQQLFGLFDKMGGSYDTFRFDDRDDNFASATVIGTGNGSQTQFQLARQFGGALVPIFDTNGAPQIFKAGALQASGYSISATGLVTFTTAPTAGQAISWSGGYYWRCRFDMGDELQVEEFMRLFWQTGTVKLITCKP